VRTLVPPSVATGAAIVGVIDIGVASVVTALAYSGKQAQSYNPLNHFVSELGEVGVSELAAMFNVALIIGGLGFVVFMAGLGDARPGRSTLVSGLAGMTSGIGGALVGVFPMNELRIHSIVALTFFGLGWIAVAGFSIDFLRRPDPLFPRWLAIPGAITVACFLGFLVVVAGAGSDALAAPGTRQTFSLTTTLEWATLISMLGWALLVAIDWRVAARAPARQP